MAISFVNVTNQYNGVGTNDAALVPSGVQVGDVLITDISFLSGGSISINSVPSGWTLIRRDDTGSGPADVSAALYLKIASASEPASYTWTLSSATYNTGVMIAMRGCNQTEPIDQHSGQSNASSTSVTAPGVTTTTNMDTLLYIGGIVAAVSFTPPSGMTEATDANSIEIAYQTGVALGATGNKVATAAGAGINIGQLVALRPAYKLDRGENRGILSGVMRGMIR